MAIWRTLPLAAISAFAALFPVQAAAQTHSGRGTEIVVYEGTVDEGNAREFMDRVYGSVDQVIGLAIVIDRPRREYSPLSVFADEQLVISFKDGDEPEQEVVINGGTGTTWDDYKIDGFYLIKSGGTHAGGAMSVGAMPVDEATIRLNPNVRIVRKPF